MEKNIVDADLKKEIQRTGEINIETQWFTPFLLIKCYHLTGETMLAENTLLGFEQAVAAGANSLAHRLLGYVNQLLGKKRKAKKCFKHAKKLERLTKPNHPQPISASSSQVLDNKSPSLFNKKKTRHAGSPLPGTRNDKDDDKKPTITPQTSGSQSE